MILSERQWNYCMVLLIVDKRYLRKKIRYINNLKQKIAKWERLGFESIVEPVEYHVWEQQRGKEQSCIGPFLMSFQDPLHMVISNRQVKLTYFTSFRRE